ncbi:MAG: hypothetical protein HUK40_04720 [Desulfobacter sp.]|nr:hypothetical protein [Desulfobacter sp.]WDP87363.1 MAG: hypothetical protein HUN05_21405 [Desulfobacter sp.]
MGLAAEYFDDGSSFVSIEPLSINPDSLTDFSLFERYPPKKGRYRFRCLLVDSLSIDKHRLMELLGKRKSVFIHKKEAKKYKAYIRENLEFILNHEAIDPKQKTDTLVGAFPFSRLYRWHWIVHVCHLLQAVPTPCFIK